MAKKDKRLWIDMCAGSELKDTQGETLSVEGADIHDLEMGKGRFNDNHGKGFFNSLGRVTEAKKILKSEDCENDRQKYYWDKIKAPYVYAKGYLYNDEDHQNAKAAAAILRNIHREDAPLAMKASVEGGVLSRGISDPTRLASTKIHSVALTFTPANNATLVEPLNLNKSDTDWEADKQLIKSVMHLAETNVPSFRHIERHAAANTIHDNILKIQELAKSLGIEIEIKDSDPNSIMQRAVMHKVSSNVIKINKLVKAINSATSQDKFQQNIGKLRLDQSMDSSRPIYSGDTATKAKPKNVLKVHASKALKDPEHLKTVHKELIDRGIHPTKAKAVIDKVKSHMAKGEDSVEKGDVGRALKHLVLAGTMAQGAHYVGGGVDKKPSRRPSSEAITRENKEDKVHSHNSKIKDPDIMINSGQYGYDEKKPGSKKDFHARRKKFKGDLKAMAESHSASKAQDLKPNFKGKDKAYYDDLHNKAMKRYETVKAKYSDVKKSLVKALTAGYGGAGAPGNLTGGGVFQPESLEDGRAKKSETTDGITYISCDSCGHEQAYMKHQVKCRDCNKNFSLDKLQDHI
jgi:hypothetical protein